MQELNNDVDTQAVNKAITSIKFPTFLKVGYVTLTTICVFTSIMYIKIVNDTYILSPALLSDHPIESLLVALSILNPFIIAKATFLHMDWVIQKETLVNLLREQPTAENALKFLSLNKLLTVSRKKAIRRYVKTVNEAGDTDKQQVTGNKQ